MAATFGLHLVFHMNSGRARFDHFANGLFGIAPARIGVHQQGQGSGGRNAPHIGENIRQRGNAQIRQPVGSHSDARTGKVKRLESAALGQHRGIGIDDANDLQRMLGGNGRPQPGSAGTRSHGRVYAKEFFIHKVEYDSLIEVCKARQANVDGTPQLA